MTLSRLVEALTHLLPFFLIAAPGSAEDDDVSDPRLVVLSGWAIGLIVAFIAGALGVALQAGVVINSLGTINAELTQIETTMRAERADQRDLATRVARLAQRLADSQAGQHNPQDGSP